VVGVSDNSSDWGMVGKARTIRGAIRIGRRWAHDHSTQTGYAGYGPAVRVYDAVTHEPIEETTAW